MSDVVFQLIVFFLNFNDNGKVQFLKQVLNT